MIQSKIKLSKHIINDHDHDRGDDEDRDQARRERKEQANEYHEKMLNSLAQYERKIHEELEEYHIRKAWESGRPSLLSRQGDCEVLVALARVARRCLVEEHDGEVTHNQRLEYKL